MFCLCVCFFYVFVLFYVLLSMINDAEITINSTHRLIESHYSATKL